MLLICFAFVACNKTKPTGQTDARFCGRWMTVNTTYWHYGNQERYWFKRDGSFIDRLFTLPDSTIRVPKPRRWYVLNNRLFLVFYFPVTYFHVFKISTPFRLSYTVQQITDSTMVLTTPATKKYPARTISLRHMKLNGKYITE